MDLPQSRFADALHLFYVLSSGTINLQFYHPLRRHVRRRQIFPLGDRRYMDKTTFGSRFQAAVAKAYVYATSMVAEPLPPVLRVNLSLNASYDGNPLEPGEVVFPEDSDLDAASLLQLTVEEPARILWRDELVPEWIDVNVVDDLKDGTGFMTALFAEARSLMQ